jgi:hypothetical protein
MNGIDTHLPLGMKGLTNMKHIYRNFPEINTACVVCRNLKFAGEWTLAECPSLLYG